MIYAIARSIPLAWYFPFRYGAVAWRRGSFQRNICIAILKVAAKAWRGLLAARIMEIRPIDAPEVSFRAVDSMVMDAIYWFGVQGYEGEVPKLWAGLCREAKSILEIGGNVGLFSVIGGASTMASYTVVEPVPAIAAVLRDNLRRNELDRVEVLEGAAIPGTSAANVILNIPGEGRGVPVGSHLVEGVEVSGRGQSEHIQVVGIPFTSLFAGRDLVKIDAEGIEAELLESVREIILRERPTLLIELLPTAVRLARLLSELAVTADYRIAVIPEWGPERIVEIQDRKLTADLPGRFHAKDVLLSPIAVRVP